MLIAACGHGSIYDFSIRCCCGRLLTSLFVGQTITTSLLMLIMRWRAPKNLSRHNHWVALHSTTTE